MNYNYYRRGGGWGTNQFQFPAPLAPTFQPQPSWGGLDYFRAHAESPDLSLYNHAWDRVRNYSGAGGDMGVGSNEARHWHRRAYGGLGNATQMLPEELGHAAAYEAYRTWMHNSSIYEPLSGDVERQREGLIGLAIAEVTRLLAFSGRSRDSYSRIEASDAAAATASVIFAQSRGMDMMDGDYPRSRAGSFSGDYRGRSSSPYGGECLPTLEAGPRTWARQEIHMHSTTGLCIPVATVLVLIPAPAAILLHRITVPLSLSLRRLASMVQLHLLRLTELTAPMAGTEAE